MTLNKTNGFTLLMPFAALGKIHLHLAELQAFEKANHMCSGETYLILAFNDPKYCLML